jgi:hypothetical protein
MSVAQKFKRLSPQTSLGSYNYFDLPEDDPVLAVL